MSKKVFLGIGHGGVDPGACANGFKESDMCLTTGVACCKALERHGVNVKMSRYADENDDINEEVRECNSFNPDLAVDIHFNSGGGDGFEAFIANNANMGKKLGQNIEAEVIKIGQNSRGLKVKLNSAGRDYFAFIRDVKAPSAILEGCFIDNKKDLELFDTEAKLKALGVAYAKGILKTLGISYKSPSESSNSSQGSKPSTNKKIMYRVVVGSYGDKNNANKVLNDAKNKGFKDAFLVAVEM